MTGLFGRAARQKLTNPSLPRSFCSSAGHISRISCSKTTMNCSFQREGENGFRGGSERETGGEVKWRAPGAGAGQEGDGSAVGGNSRGLGCFNCCFTSSCSSWREGGEGGSGGGGGGGWSLSLPSPLSSSFLLLPFLSLPSSPFKDLWFR